MPAPEISRRSNELTLVEELALLALDDATGKPFPLPANVLGYGLAGAIILDLSLAGRVDTDPHHLSVVNSAPTDNPLLDPWLNLFKASPHPQSVSAWLHTLALRHDDIQQQALDCLIHRGVLRREEKRLLWVLSQRCYPTIDGTGRTEVRTRLSQLILGDDLPAPRDAILLSLIHGCGLSDHLFTGPQFTARCDRLQTLAGTDLVGRQVTAAVISSLDAVSRALGALPAGA